MPSHVSNTDLFIWQATISVTVFFAAYLAVRYGWTPLAAWLRDQEQRLQRILVYELLLETSARTAMAATAVGMLVVGMVLYYLFASLPWFIIGATAAFFLPYAIIRHLEQKRKDRLEAQLVDGIMTLASGVRAGLNLVQAMELLAVNMTGPIKQEFAQLLREYQMGLDLNQAMHNASNRIGLRNYRLLFTAIEMHRLRGGDTGESLDRIAESIREIQRLEGKLDAITAQGRSQARMMAAMPIIIIVVYWGIDPQGVDLLVTEPIGRLILLIASAMIVGGFLWIRKIMAVDI